MPALDECHDQVVHALQKQGWITRKPLALTGEDGFQIYIDIAAERPTFTGKRYIEVKCFPQHNKTQEIYIAFGQYILYRAFLVKWKVDATVYLAVPTTAYEKLLVLWLI